MHRKQETKTRNENGLHPGSTNAERVCFGRIIFLLPMGDLNRRCHSRGDGDLMRDILYLFGAKGGAATVWLNRMTSAATYQRRLLFLLRKTRCKARSMNTWEMRAVARHIRPWICQNGARRPSMLIRYVSHGSIGYLTRYCSVCACFGVHTRCWQRRKSILYNKSNGLRLSFFRIGQQTVRQ